MPPHFFFYTYHNTQTLATTHSSHVDAADIYPVYLHAGLPHYCFPFLLQAIPQLDSIQGRRSKYRTKHKACLKYQRLNIRKEVLT